jgi:Zn-finger nucleic acid-binding protein
MMSERQGVEIDYCPQCRGVWLDRGELDKIIERSDSGDDRGSRGRRDDDRGGDDDEGGIGGFLQNIFNFGD